MTTIDASKVLTGMAAFVSTFMVETNVLGTVLGTGVWKLVAVFRNADVASI